MSLVPDTLALASHLWVRRSQSYTLDSETMPIRPLTWNLSPLVPLEGSSERSECN
jgi:hypothetical protein